MIVLRPAAERGHYDHGWLDTRHTFSFGEYYDRAHMGFRSLRVINEDRVAPGTGFGSHPHRDMEIVTYVVSGALKHRDSMGHEEVLRPGDVQRMSAGRGIVHSEYNASASEPVHFLQVWILPARAGIEPDYEQAHFAPGPDWMPLAAPGRPGGALDLHQDAAIYGIRLPAGARAAHALAPGRHAWLQVVRGALTLGGHTLRAGDGAAISDEPEAAAAAVEASEALLFDLA